MALSLQGNQTGFLLMAGGCRCEGAGSLESLVLSLGEWAGGRDGSEEGEKKRETEGEKERGRR